jgi:hypothetical protein
MVRGGGDPRQAWLARRPREWACRLGALPPMRMTASWFGPVWNPPNTRVWRDVPRLMASSPRIITQKPWSRRAHSVRERPVDMWTIGGADRLRFPRQLEKRGNARLRPHTHRPHQQGELIIDDPKNHTRPAERTNRVDVKSVDTKSPIQACPGAGVLSWKIGAMGRGCGKLSACCGSGLYPWVRQKHEDPGVDCAGGRRR